MISVPSVAGDDSDCPGRVRAIMVEVRRDLYMDELTGARLPRFDEVRERISSGLRAIAAVNARGDGA